MQPSTTFAGKEVRQTLGSFDPATFLMTLNEVAERVPFEGSLKLRDILKVARLSTLTHEFAHFVQATTTATGIRLFVFLMAIPDASLWLLAEACKANKGVLVLPIANNIGTYWWSKPVQESCHHLRRLLTQLLYYQGGWRVPRDRIRNTWTPPDEVSGVSASTEP